MRHFLSALAPVSARAPLSRAGGRVLQRKCACGKHTAGQECDECRKHKHESGDMGTLQRKLAIGASDDPLEREADRVAEHVASGNDRAHSQRVAPRIQRLAESPGAAAMHAPSSVDAVLSSSGQPLDAPLAREMGDQLGHDLSSVRVHTDARAAQSARDVNARAYTVGENVVFDRGQYSPHSHQGRRLLAHELTHVVQQSAAPSATPRVQRWGYQDIKEKVYGGMISGIHKARDATRNGLKHLAGQYLPRSLYPIADGIIDTVIDVVDILITFVMAVLGIIVGFSEGIIGMITGLFTLIYGVNKLLYDLVAGIFTNFDAAKQDLNAVWQALKGMPAALKKLVNDWLDKFEKAPSERQSLMIGELTGQVIALIATYALAAGKAGSAAKVAATTADATAATGEASAITGTVTDAATTTARARPVLTVIQGGGGSATTNTARAVSTADRVGSAALKIAPEVEPVAPPLRLVPPLPAAAPVAVAPVAAAAAAPTSSTAAAVGVGVANAGRLPRERSTCGSPTGLSANDAIPMVWYKARVDDYYPKRISVQGQTYGRDDPSNPRKLPLGEPLGVPEKFWPRPGKVMQLLPDERGSKAADFRAVLTRYGYDWSGLQADHVQDLDWGGPDKFDNLWPLSQDANLSAGPRQNSNQRITYCETASGPLVQDQTLAAFKVAPGHYGRYFRIARVER